MPILSRLKNVIKRGKPADEIATDTDLITLALVATLNPCESRLNNAIKHYAGKSFTKRQFMGLRNISPEDKVWVAFRLMRKSSISLAAADIAETVLHIYETAYPNDNRPRKAIEAAKNNDKATAAASYSYSATAAYAAAEAAHAADAATAAAEAAAYYSASYSYSATAAYAAAAGSAAAAAEAAAYSSAYAAHAAAYSAANAAAYSAASVGESARSKQEKLIRKIILKYWK